MKDQGGIPITVGHSIQIEVVAGLAWSFKKYSLITLYVPSTPLISVGSY